MHSFKTFSITDLYLRNHFDFLKIALTLINGFLNNLNIPKFSKSDLGKLKVPLMLDELRITIRNSKDGKPPGTDGLLG